MRELDGNVWLASDPCSTVEDSWRIQRSSQARYVSSPQTKLV
ncbi:MAG: hypothetical protein ACLT9P_02110 [Evtepia gabavorous]